jgi:hypothetical protein
MKRKIIEALVPGYTGVNLLSDLLDNKTPRQVIDFLQKIEEQYAGRDVFFCSTIHYSHDESYTVVNLWEHRLETDKEYENRLATQHLVNQTKQLAKDRAEKDERAQYERLKKKFEPK